MKKVSFLLLLVIVLNLFLAGLVFGSNNRERISMRFYIGDKIYFVNNQTFSMDTVPFIEEERTMLPIRYVADALGTEVKWDSGERKVTVNLKDTLVELWIGENAARVNGNYQMIDPANPKVKPLIDPRGRTVLPLRFISETLGFEVNWNQTLREVTLLYPPPLLVPEKKTVLLIEGMEEEIALYLKVSSLYPYAIYLDKDRYHMERLESKDLILPRVEVEPEIFMAIWYREDVEISTLVWEIEEELKKKYANVHVQGLVEEPLLSQHLYTLNGDAWNDPVERYYLVEDFKGNVIVIQQKLFKEAVGGHGTRFDGMLKELYIWNPGINYFSKP